MPVMAVTDRRGRQAPGVYQAFPTRKKVLGYGERILSEFMRVTRTRIYCDRVGVPYLGWKVLATRQVVYTLERYVRGK